MPCLCVGVALSGVIQPSRRAWGPCGGRGCSLWRRFEELACFLSPWGPCELWGEANLFSFLSEQHPARVWRSAPALRPPGPRHVSDLRLLEAVPRLGLGGCGDPPGPWRSRWGGECPSFSQHESSDCFTGGAPGLSLPSL